nr:cupredoxin domain-containing protein [Actinomycetota bacterium]
MKRSAVLALVALALAACSGGAARDDDPSAILPGKIQPTDGPYVSVAVDNHFHDIHRNENVEIADDRTFVIRNEGRNLHNVSIRGTDIDRDIRMGESFRLSSVGERLEPGTYQIFCRYHDYEGMTGEITVTD